MSGAVMAQTPAPVPAQAPAEAPSPSPPAAPGAPPTAGPNQPGLDLRVPQRPTLSTQEMVTNAGTYRTRINEVLAHIERLIEQARSEKDIIKINCLTDKLVQSKANLNVAEKSYSTLQEAAGRRDGGAVFHEYTRMTIVNQNVQVLAGEAEACVGEDLSYVGATRVDVDVEGVPTGDPTQPTPPNTDVSRPPSASPFI